MTDIKEIIKSRNGIFIEEIKINKRKYIRFICENNHESTKRSDDFKKTWCHECTKNTMEDAHKLAKEKGFKFLSTEYKHCHGDYLWGCSEGHQWTAKYYNIYSGRGCPKCKKVPFSYYEDLVTSKGGKIITLEEDYNDISSRIKYVCKDGHNRECTGASLRQGVWCRECQLSLSERTCRKIFEYLFKVPFYTSRHLKNPETGKGIELDGYNCDLKIAFEYNGAQHYKKVGHWQSDETFDDQCKRDIVKEKLCSENGIKLIVIPYTVKYEKLYEYIVEHFPEHAFEKTIDYSILTIESYKQDRLDDVRNMIKEQGGTLITTKYINNSSKMDFVCKNGHKFQSTLGLIQQGFFCKKCTNDTLSSKTLPKIEEFCKKFNYEMLSEYTRAKDKLKWRCTVCNTNIETTWDSMRIRKNHFNCIINNSPTQVIKKVLFN